MRKTLFTILHFLWTVSFAYSQVTGKVLKLEETDHSGIRVVFLATSSTAISDSTITSIDGSYSIHLMPGLYQIILKKEGYSSIYYQNNYGASVMVGATSNLGVTYISKRFVVLDGALSGRLKKENIYLTQGFGINEGDTLEIEPGTSIYFSSKSMIYLRGTLIAKGNELDSITFSSDSKLFGKTPVSYWEGFSNTAYDFTGRVVLQYCKLSHISTDPNGHLVYGNASISHCSFHNVSKATILSNKGTSEFRNCSFVNCDEIGFASYGNSYTSGVFACNKIQYEGVSINNSSTRKAILTTMGDGFRIEDNVFDFNGLNKGSLLDTWLVLARNTVFRNNYLKNFQALMFEVVSSNPTQVNATDNNTFSGGRVSLYESSSSGTFPPSLKNNIFDCHVDFLSPQLPKNCLFTKTFSPIRAYPSFGKKSTVNANGDSVDVYSNLFGSASFLKGLPPLLSVSSIAIQGGLTETGAAVNIGFDPKGTCQEKNFPTDSEVIYTDTFSITGRVHKGENLLTEGVVMAIPKTEGKTRVSKILNGAFKVDSLPKGDYFLYAIPSTNVTNYLPTYYVNKVTRELAATIQVVGKIIDVDLYLVPLAHTEIGSSRIQGRIGYGDNSSDDNLIFGRNWLNINYSLTPPLPLRGAPCGHLPLLVYNTQNKMVRWAITDPDGYFDIPNLSGGTYYLKPERMGYVLENDGQVHVPAGNTEKVILYMLPTSPTAVEETESEKASDAFPNPFHDKLKLNYSGSVTITDLMGTSYYHEEAFANKEIITENWPKGIYLIKIGHQIIKVIKN